MLVVLGFQIVLNYKYLNDFVILSSINVLQDVRWHPTDLGCVASQTHNLSLVAVRKLFWWKQVPLFCVVNSQQKPVLSGNSSVRQRVGNVLEDRDRVGLQKPAFGPAVAVEELYSLWFFVVLQKTPRVSGKKSYLCPSPKSAVIHWDNCKPGSFVYLTSDPPALQLNILFLWEATWTGEENEMILLSAAWLLLFSVTSFHNFLVYAVVFQSLGVITTYKVLILC